MLWISHYGNIYGKNVDKENSPDYIWYALNEGYNVFVNLWFLENGSWMLGTNEPCYAVYPTNKLMLHRGLWFRPMNEETRQKASIMPWKLYDPTLFPKDTPEHILYLPESNLSKKDQGREIIRTYHGVCSDYIGYYKQRDEAKINIGILIGGRLTCHKTCLLPQIIHYLNEYKTHWIDVFISINDVSHNLDSYLHQSFINAPFITDITCESYIVNESYLSYPYKVHGANVSNCMSMFYNNMKAMHMLKQYRENNDIEYNLVLKYRPDIVQKELPIRLDMIIDTFANPHTIYMPIIRCYPTINDQIAVGSFYALDKYCSAYTDIIKNLDARVEGFVFHPETMLGYHLKEMNIHIVKFDYEYELDERRR